MSGKTFKLAADERGDIRVQYTLSWDCMLDSGDSPANRKLYSNLTRFTALSDAVSERLVDRVPTLMRIIGDVASKLIDLDSVAVLLSKGKAIGYVDGENCYALDGTIIHSGNDLTGTSAGADEDISINLSRLPAEVDALALLVDSANGHSLGEVKGATCVLREGRSAKVITQFDIDASDNKGITHLFGLIRRTAGGFDFSEVNHTFDGHDHDAVTAVLKKYL